MTSRACISNDFAAATVTTYPRMMDYHSQDISNFSSSSPHRMPTVSAAQALQDLQSPTRSISTGLGALDGALLNGGVSRGQVTEVYGPPGVGKTALGIQLATSALLGGQGVLWVDAGHPLPGRRLSEVLSSAVKRLVQDGEPPPEGNAAVDCATKNLIHFVVPTLPHFIALLCQISPFFPPQTINLIVIDSFSSLIASAYPKTVDNRSTSVRPDLASKYDRQGWAASRKWAVLQSVISSLQKLATLRNIAIVILSQNVTKMQSGCNAVLIPAIASTAWDAGVSTRIVLFRDWNWEGKQVRFARVVKLNGVLQGSNIAMVQLIAFTIEPHGLAAFQIPETATIPSVGIIATPSRKRKADEIRDSDEEVGLEESDEDYRWAAEDDSELPQPPSQWQGSEDILVPFQEEQDGEEEEGIGEEENSDAPLLLAITKEEDAPNNHV